MGVNGLWTVLQPCARPTNLATLNRKRLAVDASIWIYQFLKAVRDKEGNALRNSHVVGFFRRICKLLWFGIKPVFVFDGGAPVLKRATLQGRRRRREGRREDAVRTANKLLALQMQRLAEAEAAGGKKRRKDAATANAGDEDGVAEGEVIPSSENLVYADEQLLDNTERQKNRKFFKQDAYHLPDLDKSMHEMGQPNDPRVMSIEELESYAQQFHRGEDINLYDFSKIDFDGDFFKSLPSADRYNILNAARLRSRLRMGISKEQLESMFPNRRDFSRFQIERVQERNRLTQRLMLEMGMIGSTDLTIGGRINSDRGREYILVKNDGVEGGWALGIVTREKDKGEAHNPIDVDAPSRYALPNSADNEEWEDEDEFEDVPIEGLNRLPKPKRGGQEQLVHDGEDGSMFVDHALLIDDLLGEYEHDILQADEEEDISRAIALSLRNQHGTGEQSGEASHSGNVDESVEAQKPEWEQKAAEPARSIPAGSGKTIAHVVNSRANRLVPRPRVVAPVVAEAAAKPASDLDSDSDDDLQAALAKVRKKRQQEAAASTTTGSQTGTRKANPFSAANNPFGGPLPFEKLDWRAPAPTKKVPEAINPGRADRETTMAGIAGPSKGSVLMGGLDTDFLEDDDNELEGGFERPVPEPQGPRPIPPWMLDTDTDIREAVKNQTAAQADMNNEDRKLVLEEQRQHLREMNSRFVQIESSEDESGDEVEIVEPPPENSVAEKEDAPKETLVGCEPAVRNLEPGLKSPVHSEKQKLPTPQATETQSEERPENQPEEAEASPSSEEESEFEFEFEDVQIEAAPQATAPANDSTEDDVQFEDVTFDVAQAATEKQTAIISRDGADAFDALDEFDDFSDSEDEELLAQMAEEAEEHARFASTLNNNTSKAADANRSSESYETELRQLRAQQKKDRRDADEVSQVMVAECQQLLRLFGIPYITAPMEAEAQCAELVRLGLVDGIVTDDSDTFLFGGTRVYKNMFNGNKYVECYLSSDLERDLSLSRANLISLAQLLGSDYTDGLPGVGPVTAVEILSEFPGQDGLAGFAEWWREVQQAPPPASTVGLSPFRRKFRKSQATRLFLPPGFPSPAVPEAYLRPEVDSDPQPFQWGAPDLPALREFLMATVGWGPERTDEVLVPVIRDVNRREMEGTQSNITRFFTGGVGVGAREEQSGQGEAFAQKRTARGGSKRMANAVSRLRAQAGEDRETAGEDGEKAGGDGTRRKRKARGQEAATGDEEDGDNTEADAEEGSSSGRGRRKRGRGTRGRGSSSV